MSLKKFREIYYSKRHDCEECFEDDKEREVDTYSGSFEGVNTDQIKRQTRTLFPDDSGKYILNPLFHRR